MRDIEAIMFIEEYYKYRQTKDIEEPQKHAEHKRKVAEHMRQRTGG